MTLVFYFFLISIISACFFTNVLVGDNDSRSSIGCPASSQVLKTAPHSSQPSYNISQWLLAYDPAKTGGFICTQELGKLTRYMTRTSFRNICWIIFNHHYRGVYSSDPILYCYSTLLQLGGVPRAYLYPLPIVDTQDRDGCGSSIREEFLR